MGRARPITVVLIAAFLGAVVERGQAQDTFPSRLVTLVVPSPAGSTTDALARIVADRLGRRWGKSVIVENNARGLNAGGEQVARAKADGYTLLVSPPLPLTIARLLYRDIGYDPARFAPVALLAKIPNVLSVRSNLPVQSIKELVAYGKANPEKLTYASQGIGSTAHLSGAQLEVRAGIKMVHVPYRGSAPALNDIMAGNVDMFFDTLATSVPLYKAGKLRILAVAGTERSEVLPEVPTIAESGFPGFRSVTWFAMAAPPNTPSASTEKINRDVMAVLQQPQFEAKLHELQLEPMIGTPADAAALFAEETRLWGDVIREAHVSVP
jgi:tripartite-type tricarboxylate transporter receptor subunit TctC